MSRMRVVVIGAGIGGLAAAAALEAVGVEVVVLERADENQKAGAGIALGPNALAALEQLGAVEHVLAHGNTASGRIILTRRGDVLSDGPWKGGIVRRADLHEALLQQLRAPVRFGRRCTGFEQDSAGVRVQLADGGEEHGDVLVGADGLRSQIRARLYGAADPIYRGATSWRGIVRFEHEIVADRIIESWGHGRRVGLQNLGHGWMYWFAARNAREGSEHAPAERKRNLLESFRGWHEPVEEVLAATDATEILQTDLYDRDPLPHWSTGRVTVLGDAAHPMTPDLGQGGAQAIEDGLALAECFGADADVPSALRAYEEHRLAFAYGVMRRARRHYRISQLENPAACWLRDTAVKRLPAAAQLAFGVRRPSWAGGGTRG